MDLHVLETREFLSCDELAEAFAVTVGTIKKWSKTGQLPAPALVGEKYVFSTKSIRDMLNQKVA